MSSSSGNCPGILSNPDISGPGVRIALYLQSLLSIILVRFSPKDAPGAYWSMTSTAFSLIITSFVTSATGGITLLDAIVVVYVLFLPILVSAFGLSEIVAPANKTTPLRSAHSPLLIVANWTRSALTYSFALYVWISAPTFGSGPSGCNAATRLIFFGASLPALGSGRYLNLTIWGVLTLLFFYRTLRSYTTILVATAALFSSTASQALLKPKKPPKNEIHREIVTTKKFATGETTRTNRLFRPRQIFHELLQGLVGQILGWSPSSTSRWYKVYGRPILICIMGAWAIVMTELELLLNPLSQDPNGQWSFGQILPMVLTISPLFSLYESILSRQASGPVRDSRILRFRIKGARGLQRPYCEVDSFSQELIDIVGEEEIEARRAPTAFAVITIDEREQYTTFEIDSTTEPNWDESFDIKVGDMSTVVIRVFDRKCIDQGRPAFIGFTTILPFSILPPPKKDDQPANDDPETPADMSKVDLGDIPLVCEGTTVPDMTVSISLSTDTRFQPTLPYVPPLMTGPLRVEQQRRVTLVKWGNKKYGGKKETNTHVYNFNDV